MTILYIYDERKRRNMHVCRWYYAPHLGVLSTLCAELSNDHKGRGLCKYCDEHPLALRTECSTTPKWRSVIPSAYMHVSAFTPHQCSFVCSWIRDDSVFNQ